MGYRELDFSVAKRHGFYDVDVSIGQKVQDPQVPEDLAFRYRHDYGDGNVEIGDFVGLASVDPYQVHLKGVDIVVAACFVTARDFALRLYLQPDGLVRVGRKAGPDHLDGARIYPWVGRRRFFGCYVVFADI